MSVGQGLVQRVEERAADVVARGSSASLGVVALDQRDLDLVDLGVASRRCRTCRRRRSGSPSRLSLLGVLGPRASRSRGCLREVRARVRRASRRGRPAGLWGPRSGSAGRPRRCSTSGRRCGCRPGCRSRRWSRSITWRRLTSKTELFRTLLSSRASSARLAIASISSWSLAPGSSGRRGRRSAVNSRRDFAVERLEGLAGDGGQCRRRSASVSCGELCFGEVQGVQGLSVLAQPRGPLLDRVEALGVLGVDVLEGPQPLAWAPNE